MRWTPLLALCGLFSVNLPATATIPPAFTETALHSPNPGFFGAYGRAVAIAGRTVLVGAPSEGTGAVYVYQREGGLWREQARLVPENPEDTLDFGGAVALSGDTAVVGAAREGALSEGAVYVFVRQGETWVQEARLTGAVASLQGAFGVSVSVFANRLIVGMPGADDRGEDSGVAEIYVRQDGGWVRQARLSAPGAHDHGYFGHAVDIHGTTALVGSPRQAQAAGALAGAAHLFAEDEGTWLPLAELRAGDAAALDSLGFSVSLSANAAIVGAPYADPYGVMNAGAAYVFEPVGVGGAWQQTAKLVDAAPNPHDEFGFAVSVSGGTAAVGAWRDDARGGDAGWVHLFDRLPAGDWGRQGDLVSSDIQSQDRFGAALDISNGVIVAGAFRAHDQGVSRAGQAYIFEPGTAAGLRLVVVPARQTVASGADASLIIHIRNTGDMRLRRYRVTVAGAPACTFVLGPLLAGQRRALHCTIENLTEDFAGVVSATGTPVAGFTVSASAEVEIRVE